MEHCDGEREFARIIIQRRVALKGGSQMCFKMEPALVEIRRDRLKWL
jgi:hypothetical protein